MEGGSKVRNSPEPKKESRLTSIIDQLRSNKTKETKDESRSQSKRKASDRNHTNSPWHEQSDACVMPTDAAAERGPSPEPESSSSPSLSPHSPSPFPALLVPGFRAAPAAPAIKQMEMMTRNYSDFMRSLAAKYNQSNAQDSFSAPQSNGFVRSFDPFKGSFLMRGLEGEGNGAVGLASCFGRKAVDNQSSPTPPLSESRNPLLTNSSDFSSSQTLLNLVRTASAQSASQLENYLKGAVKRSADGDNRLDPLDLTTGSVKRPKLDLNLLQNEVDGPPLLGSSRPSWLTFLAEKRVPHSPPSSSRTSPKIQRCASLCTDKSCTTQSEASDLANWTVDDVVKFVSSVETCIEYAEKFREESIDGSTLTLLTEEHLTMHMGMKLGPALKLRSTLARRIGHCAVCMHCVHCHRDDNNDNRRHEASRSPTVSK